MSARPVAACGTNSGYQRHWRAGEPACDACVAAHTETGRRRRAEQGESTSRAERTRRERIRTRALAALKDLYPADYWRLYAEIAEADHPGRVSS